MINRRLIAGVEIVLFLALIFGYLWLLIPLRNVSLTLGGLGFILALATGSHLIRREGLKALGLRIDNLLVSMREVGTFTVSSALIVAGACSGSLGVPEGLFRALLGYLLWAFMQEYVFQAFFNLRFQEVLGGSPGVIWATTTCFALVHWPNLFLVGVTFAAGWFWSFSFRRSPNLFTITLSHGLLGTMVKYFIPRRITHDLVVGPFFR